MGSLKGGNTDMGNLHITRRQILKGAGAAGIVTALAPVAAFADEDEGAGRVRWDLITFVNGCITPGGSCSANAEGSTTITVTGHGTFPNVRNHCTRDVTGGGTWTVASGDTRCLPGTGSYRVTELLSWNPAPGGHVPP